MTTIEVAERDVLFLHKLYDEVQMLQRRLPQKQSKTNNYVEIENSVQELARDLYNETQKFTLKYSPYALDEDIKSYIQQADNIAVGALGISSYPYKRY